MTSGMRVLAATVLAWWVGVSVPAFCAPVMLATSNVTSRTRADLTWPAEPERQYDVQTRTNLMLGAWGPATNAPVAPTNLIGRFQSSYADSVRFFRVVERDNTGPKIVYRYPAVNGIGVGRSAVLTVAVEDETGVNTNAFSLSINNGVPLANGSAGAACQTNLFQYTPGTNAWGSYGGTASVRFVCADILGNTTTSHWNFTLGTEPAVTNALVHLRPSTGGNQVLVRPTLVNAAIAHGVTFSDNLTIISIATNQVLFGYTGSHGLYEGVILINHDPAQFFYRRVVGLVDDPANQRITAQTVDVPLTDIVQEGSFSAEVFVPSEGSGMVAQWQRDLNYTMPFAYASEFTVLPIETGPVRITPGILSVDMKGSVQVGCVIKDWRVVAFDATVSSALEESIRTRIEFLAQAPSVSETRTLATVPLGFAVAYVAGVPAKMDLQLAVDLGFTAAAEGALAFDYGVDAAADTTHRLDWRPDVGWNSSSENEFSVVPAPLDMGFQVSAEAFLYLKPRLSVLLYSLAGVSADYRRGPALEASYEVGDPQCELTLYDKWSVNAGMTIRGVDDGELPNLTLVEEKRVIKSWYWPEASEQAPVFTTQPRSVDAAEGTPVVLNASATGNPAPTYQWYQNGVSIPFKNQASLSFTAAPQSAGNYHVAAENKRGRVVSASATVTVLPSSSGSRPRLTWPLPWGNPYTANCAAVMDHDSVAGRVTAYNGEVGSVNPVVDGGVTGYAKADGTPFLLPLVGGYDDDIAPAGENTLLWYDGHPAYDYPAAIGTEIRAAAAGRLFAATDQTTPNGGIWRNPTAAARFTINYDWDTYHTFYIIHSGGLSTWYLHANGLHATVAQRIADNGYADVTDGQVVGYTGDKGTPGSEHLHFSVKEATGTTTGGRVTTAKLDPYGNSDTDFSDILWKQWPTATPPAPSGMALIPAGSFSMGDSFSEGYSDERPVHAVYVSAFYMDRCEVTKALWDEVRAWGLNNGYTDLPAGGGKVANHPVQSITWYAMVKWCNARSEKEGRTPAYYTSSARTTVYRTGSVSVQNDWVRWDTGYRLPTEAEWEKAARGGASGQRFPWSDSETIQHARANYYSSTSYSYDTSPTRGYHPDYDDGGTPYTSPVGAFAANGYGLYDMAGNVWEWCWDWYDSGYYGASPGSDPRGPTSGSHRVLRGGGWGGLADFCRGAGRGGYGPDSGLSNIGFRAVMPPGQ